MHTSSCLPATHTKQIGPENLQSFKLPLWPSLVCLCDWQVLLLNMLCAMVDVRACFYSEVFVVFLYVGPCPLCVSLSLRLRKLENNKCFHMYTGRWNALLVNIKLPLRVGKREGDGDGSYFFFLLPGYYRGGGRLKSKMLTRKMTLNGSGLKRRIIDLLWLVEEEGEGGKKYIFLSTGVPPRANKWPRKVNNTYFMPSTCVCVNVT